jgi:glycosyltransferase involved in cell wall biosynthesis
MKKKVLIVGAFAFKAMDTGGQPVKTRELYYALQNQYGKNQVDYLETVGWKKKPLTVIKDFFTKAKNSKNIIMLPAQKGVIVFSKLLLISRKLFGNKIFYDVIGGWLPDKIKGNKKLSNDLRKFDGIWVETNIMNRNLKEQGFSNTYVVRNFKRLTPIDINKIHNPSTLGLKICIFSRLMKEKGIMDAVKAVTDINSSKTNSIKLDIYGPVDPSFTEQFELLKEHFSDGIQYKGIVKPEKSVEVLRNYDALLFPTRYATEGLPGTIIDAYAAGIPVISSKWNSFSDIVNEGKTGIGYPIGSFEGLVQCLNWACDHKEELSGMKLNCVAKAREFLPQSALSEIIGGGYFN